MTEAEWLASEDTDQLLKWLQKSRKHRPARRKLGLFACACARRLGTRVEDEVTTAGLYLAERMAEGPVSPEEFRSFLGKSMRDGHQGRFTHIAVWAVRVFDTGQSWSSPEGAARSVAGFAAQELGTDEPAEQCRLLREIIGNPYRPVPPFSSTSLAWNNGTVRRLAEAAYEDRELPSGRLDPARLAVLADALEEAGCTEADLLDHLRRPGPHVRGCFVLDLLLGKA
jgi:hypothetical protein